MDPVCLVLFIVVALAVCGMHAAAAFGGERLRTVGITVGMCLHIPLFLLMLAMSWTLQIAAMVFMASIALYSVLGTIAYRRHRAAEAADEEGEV